MIKSIDSQGFYATFTQSIAKQNTHQNTTQALEFQNVMQNSLSDYQTNMQKVYSGEYGKTEASLDMQTFIKSQSILGEVSQSRYERALKSLLSRVNNFMQGIQKDSPAYDFVDRIYENVIYWAEPEKIVIKNNRFNKDEKADTLTLVQESKDKLLISLNSKSSSISRDFKEFKEQLSNYETCLEHIMQEFLPFFAAFESEFSQSQMQTIVDELAIIRAYNDYKAHNITLADGSTISWERDERGMMNIFINGTAIETYLENTKLLKDSENFVSLLEILEKKSSSNDEGVDIKEKLSEVAEDMSEKLRAVRENLDKLSATLVSDSKAEFAELVSAQMALNLGESANLDTNLNENSSQSENLNVNLNSWANLGTNLSANSALQENLAVNFSVNSHENSKESPLKMLLQDI